MLDDETTIPKRTLVAAIGAAPNRLLDSLPCPRDSRGRLVADENLAVSGYPGVWAVGDCAAIPDVLKGGTCPPTAQYALRQAAHVARNILATINGAPPRPFAHRGAGVFVPLGKYSAAAELLKLKLSGLVAWWLYRSYYLYQLPRIERKIRVLLDWNLALIFRRDIVQHDITRTERTTRAHYEPGQLIIRQGELARSFYIILGGRVEVVRQQDGHETEVAVLGPGELFGGDGAAAGRPENGVDPGGYPRGPSGDGRRRLQGAGDVLHPLRRAARQRDQGTARGGLCRTSGRLGGVMFGAAT